PGRRPPLYSLMETLEAGIDAVAPVQLVDARQPPGENVIVGTVARGGKRCRFAVDWNDLPSQIECLALAEVDLYCKLQYRRGGYRVPRIVPGGFVPSELNYYRYLDALRARAAEPRRRAVYARFGHRFQAALRRQVVAILAGVPGIELVGADGKVR